MKKLFTLMLLALVGASTTVRAQQDFANFGRFEADNERLAAEPNNGKRVVFMGNSITEGWIGTHPKFFSDNGYIGRGIGGQTSYQMLLRFTEDVINLKPAAVVINAGTNDVAINNHPYSERRTYENIVAMATLAQAHGIKVILTSVLPAASFAWRPEITDAADKIASLNARIKKYAEKNGFQYVDYYSALVYGENRELNPNLRKDVAHPNAAGYDVMEPLVQKAIKKVL
ncbi:MAG: SGNH/GDSL hydrolase family protein [Bacteroidaceae bacterium]|nr:SGNH/GDSL hydrolase family protein [Bacteroidaceae bacterium]